MRRAILALLAVALFVVLGAAPAHAATKSADPPNLSGQCDWWNINLVTFQCAGKGLTGTVCETPESSNPAYFGGIRPRQITTSTVDANGNGADGKPWVPSYTEYGTGNFIWHTCDVSVTDTGPGFSTWVANQSARWGKLLIAVYGMATDAALHPEDWRDILIQLAIAGTAAIKRVFYDPDAGTGISVISLVALVGAVGAVRKLAGLKLRALLGYAASAAILGFVAAAIFTYPGQIITGTTDATTGFVTYANTRVNPDAQTGDPGDTASNVTNRVILWPQWLQGTLGSTTSATALKYGPCLFRASNNSWTEQQVIDTQPGSAAANAIIKAHDGEWQRCAEQVKKDPAAYKTLQGKTSDPRDNAGLMILVLALCVLPLGLVAAVKIIVAALKMVACLFVTLINGMKSLITGTTEPVMDGLTIGGEGLRDAAVYGVASALNFLAITIVYSPTINANPFVRALIMVLIAAALWGGAAKTASKLSGPEAWASRKMRGGAKLATRYALHKRATRQGTKEGNKELRTDDNDTTEREPRNWGTSRQGAYDDEPEPLAGGSTYGRSNTHHNVHAHPIADDEEFGEYIDFEDARELPAGPTRRAAAAAPGRHAVGAAPVASTDTARPANADTVTYDEAFATAQTTRQHRRWQADQAAQTIPAGEAHARYTDGYDPSTVVDEDGEPMVIYTPGKGYHTTSDIDSEETAK